MAANIDENDLPLSEFIKLPTTVDFNVINTDRFKLFIQDKPYIKLGDQMANELVVVYTNKNNLPLLFEELGNDFNEFFPKIMSPLDSKSNEDSGIAQILNQPFLNLTGRNVIIGFVDTGIDYTKEAFRFEDGSTKILYIWDQTIDGNRPDYLYFGSLYTQDDINRALNSDDPYSIVPSIDEDGHGTFMASVAASNERGEYIGAAPKAYIIAVKLRRANEYYIDKFLLPKDNPNLYQSTDYVLGMKFIMDRSEEINLPIVMCITMGSNSSGHDGNTLFEDYISFVSQRAGYVFVAAAGNESNARHHTQGLIPRTGTTDTFSVKVGRQDDSFILSIYGPAYDKVSVSVTSPTGEVIARLPFRVGLKYSEKLIFENTTITIEYYKGVNNITFIGFELATEGIWDITLFGDAIVSGEYHAWLPITGQISPFVEMFQPVPEYTIVYPATALRCVTCGAYNSTDNSLYISSSWGPTRLPRMSPDLVAPGVNVGGIYPTGYGTKTGTSVSAAVTAGAAALLLEWGLLQGNIPAMDGDLVRTFLISGATRDENMLYPNIKWGYGRLDLYGSFTVIKESVINYYLL
ncbi:subtilase family protein [Anaerotignum neopropionicum]|uniref:Subtilase family protein n=1 Tax=Anaerotignum neopropionicum TaxID=36847 RepID=A0A136WFS2_9FIRM|nr:S8 family peptidase [Anaerotignum neopropionicum]KXL53209.1 subtilase family protein [Anaerotignum neopropionicum]